MPWITINGAHVLVGEDGEVQAGGGGAFTKGGAAVGVGSQEGLRPGSRSNGVLQVTQGKEVAEGSIKRIEFHAPGGKVADITIRQDYVHAKPGDRLRSKMATVFEYHIEVDLVTQMTGAPAIPYNERSFYRGTVRSRRDAVSLVKEKLTRMGMVTDV